MSFISILSKVIGIGAKVEHVVVPIAGALYPPAAVILSAIDGIVQRVQAGIVTVEANTPTDGAGALKAAAVVADFQAGLDLTQQILSLEKRHLAYDAAQLQAAITAQVSAYNAFSLLKASFKVEPLP